MVARKECGYVQSITCIHDYGYTYDGRGNLVKEEEICSPTTQGPKNITIATYTYDETNKMVSGTNWWAQSVKKCVYSDYVHTDRLGSVVKPGGRWGQAD